MSVGSPPINLQLASSILFKTHRLHTAVDFIIGLPPLDGNTTLVDMFFNCRLQWWQGKLCILASYVFCLHGFPWDIATDPGHSLHLNFGKPSSTHLVPWWVTPLVTTHSPLVLASTGLSPFMASIGYQYLCLSSRRRRWQCHLNRPTCITVRACIVGSALPSEILPHNVTMFQPHPICRARRSGCPLRICPPSWLPENCCFFWGPFVNDCIVNPSSGRLKLRPSLKVQRSFHVSQIKPVNEMDLVPPPSLRLPSMLMLVVQPTWRSAFWMSVHVDVASSSWSNVRGMDLRTSLGFLSTTSWIAVYCAPCTRTIPVSLAGLWEASVEGKELS